MLEDLGLHHTPVRMIIHIVAVGKYKIHPSLHNFSVSLAAGHLTLFLGDGYVLPCESARQPGFYKQIAND